MYDGRAFDDKNIFNTAQWHGIEKIEDLDLIGVLHYVAH